MVMSIIVLLVAMSLPSLRRSIRQARSTVCKSNLKEVYVALDIYRVENNGWLPVGNNPNDRSITQSWWSNLAEPNPGIRGVLICPDDPWAPILRETMLQNPTGLTGAGSYGLNDFILASPDAFLANLGRFSPSRPDDTILVADLGPDVVTPNPSALGVIEPPVRNNGKLAIDDRYRPGQAPAQREGSWLTNRHMGFINVLTCVGNVRRLPVRPALDRRINSYYESCAAGDCTLCRYLDVPHYSFTEGHAYWWTGPLPRP
ncbi:MAG: hypothetical protein H6816_13690 [Phycisphaerales bacterium]|nr:hypothetical protein [Phycisphaerales bacterium]